MKLFVIAKQVKEKKTMGYNIDIAFERNGGVYIKHGSSTQCVAPHARLLGFTSDRVVYMVDGEKYSRYYDTVKQARGVLH